MYFYFKKFFLICLIVFASFSFFSSVEAGILSIKKSAVNTDFSGKITTITKPDDNLASQSWVEGKFYFFVNTFLGFLALILLCLISIAGYKWMTAAGNEDRSKEAIDTIRRAVVGLLFIISAYAVTKIVFSSFFMDPNYNDKTPVKKLKLPPLDVQDQYKESHPPKKSIEGHFWSLLGY